MFRGVSSVFDPEKGVGVFRGVSLFVHRKGDVLVLLSGGLFVDATWWTPLHHGMLTATCNVTVGDAEQELGSLYCAECWWFSARHDFPLKPYKTFRSPHHRLAVTCAEYRFLPVLTGTREGSCLSLIHISEPTRPY